MGDRLAIVCPSCGRSHRPGTLFCSECGAYLSAVEALGTEPLLSGAGATAEGGPYGAVPVDGQTGPAPLRLKILSTGRQVQLPAIPDVLLGRLDAAHSIFPDLDLTSDGGLVGGVSRRHCRIHCQGTCYFVEDVGSANGTFLGGQRLTPYLPHVLKSGDELQLGQVKMEVIVAE